MNDTYNLLSKNEDLNNKGCLLFDIGIYFPYDNQDIVTFKYVFLEEYNENLELDKIVYCEDKKFNHRYPNKGYITLAKTYGRKVCPVGYPVVDTIENLNKYKFIIFELGIEEKCFYHCIPININLAENKPYNIIRININFEEPNVPEFCIDIESLNEKTKERNVKRYTNKHYENPISYNYISYIN